MPRSSTDSSRKSRPPDTHANRPEKRLQQLVLLVDDGKEFRQGLRALLENAGYLVLEAAAGDQALQIMADERVEVLLVDLIMPGLNGLELLREMRRQASPRLQIIALTGAQPLDARLKPMFRSLGVSKFISKPVEIGILLEAIEAGRLTAKTLALAPGVESDVP